MSPSRSEPLGKGLTVEGAREQVAMLVSEERRVWESGLSWSIPVEGGSEVRACGGNGTGSLGALVRYAALSCLLLSAVQK